MIHKLRQLLSAIAYCFTERKNMEEKKIGPIRVVLFIISLGLAIYFMARGVYKLTNQEPGYYDLEATADKETATYASGITCTYLFEGSSNEIKRDKRAAEECYSGALLRLYKLTDGDTEYEGFTNIATINKNIGSDISVNDELYAILEDAYRKTSLGQDYSVFAGSYYDHWNSILTLDDAQNFDPLLNSEEAQRIENLRKQVTDSTNFKLVFKGNNTVCLEVSDSYLEYIKENEESAKILDLNVLREAYMIKYVKESMAQKGYIKGRITTDLGLYLDLGDYGTGGYTPAKVAGGELLFSDPVAIGKDECMSGITALSLKEDADCYYTVSKDSTIYYRNPFVTLKEGGFVNYIGSSYVKSGVGGNIVDVMYQNIILNAASDKAEVDGYLQEKGPFERLAFEIK